MGELHGSTSIHIGCVEAIEISSTPVSGFGTLLGLLPVYVLIS